MIKKKENLNNENKNQMAYNNSQNSQKKQNKKPLNKQLKSHQLKEGIYKLLAITKKLFQKTKRRNFLILKTRNEELKKYILQYKVINKMFRLYNHKQKLTCKIILKDWISNLKSKKKSKTKKN